MSTLLQNVENFTLARDEKGNVLLEDGKGRCPFDPNFKSTALVVGECWGQDGFIEVPCGGTQGQRASSGQAGFMPCLFPRAQNGHGLALGLVFPSSSFLLCPPQAKRAVLGSLWVLSREKGPC